MNFSTISTLSSVRSGVTQTSSRHHNSASQQNVPIKRVDVSGVGFATEVRVLNFRLSLYQS